MLDLNGGQLLLLLSLMSFKALSYLRRDQDDNDEKKCIDGFITVVCVTSSVMAADDNAIRMAQ